MVQLDLDNIYLSVNGLEPEDETKIWNILSFPVQVFGMKEVRYRHVYNRKTKKTYAGLLQYVTEYLEDNDIEYKLNDNRIKPEQNGNFSLVEYVDKEKTIPLKLRPYQQKVVDNCREREIIQVATGGGKAMPLDTAILTPNGFVQLKDIHVGDIVFDEDGNKTMVVGEYPQEELKAEYKITFNDGTSAICCEDHMWKYKLSYEFNENNWKETSLKEMLSKYKVISDRSYNIAIPVAKAIQFDKKDLLIHPYAMGLLIGDGGFTNRTITFTNVENDIIEKLNGKISQFGSFKYRKNKDSIQLHFVGGRNNPFREYIVNTFNFSNSKKKFIPKEYLFSSIEDRLEFARGLIDTDGSIDMRGHIRFTTSSKQLANDFVFLIRSLGYRTKLSVKNRHEKGIEYAVYVRSCDDMLFLSKKHKEKFAKRSKHKNHHYELMKIVSIKKLNTKTEMKCISVDSEKHTFICNDFIVTHNTCIMSALIPHFNVKPVLVFADKIGLCQQLKSELEKFLGVEVGLVGDGVKDYKDITVVSIQSAEDEYLEKAKMCLFDECFPYKTKVMLDNGRYEEIGLICHKMSKGEQFSVMSYNIETDEFEPKRVINYGKKNSSTTKFIRVRVQDEKGYKQEVTCTDNHKFFVYNNKEYIMAKDLKIDDEVVYVKRDRPNDWFKHEIWKVIAVDYVGRTTKYVYDLTVEDNHNFFADRVLVSNCHHIPSDTLSTVAMKCVNAYYRIGVSATPWRDTNDDILIEAALAKQNKEDYISASKLIELGYLVEPTIYFVPIKDKFKGKNYQQVYNSAIVLNENRNKIIYKIAQKMYEKNKHILILFKQVNHGTEIALNLQKIISNKTHPIKIVNPKNNKDVTIMVKEVELLSGSDDTIKRLAVFEAIRQGICRCLVASTIADEGLDLPILDTLILAGGGKSSTRAFQRVGRVLRLHEGKEKAIVFDFKDFTPMLRRHSRERQKYYLKEPAWNIKEFNVSPD